MPTSKRQSDEMNKPRPNAAPRTVPTDSLPGADSTTESMRVNLARTKRKKTSDAPVYQVVVGKKTTKDKQAEVDPVLAALQAFCEENPQTRKFIPPNSCQMSDEDARAFFSAQAQLNRPFTAVKYNQAGERLPDGLCYSNGDGALYSGSEKDIQEQLKRQYGVGTEACFAALKRFDEEMTEVNRRFPKVVQSVVEVMESSSALVPDESRSPSNS